MSILAPVPVRAAHRPPEAQTPASSSQSQLDSPPTPTTPRKRARSQSTSRPPSRTERKFTCTHPGCSKAYFKPSRLAEHQRTHTGERPHVCHCGQSYLRASHLAAHARTHKDETEKNFACPRCVKKFWTATHLRRHEAAHDSAEEYPCSQCDEVFPKSHLLREHYVTHLPEGSKPFPCECGKSFATKQQLRTHEKTHDPSRYTCSHPDHGIELPVFPVWTALQAHMREAHPPKCPHVECDGRVFKSSQRLKEHLKVHAEREEDIANGGSESEDLPIIEEAGRRRRRKRDIEEETGERPQKLQRLASGEAGKDWTCGAPGCGKAFKSKFARDEHSQAAHSSGRHKCEICGRAYRRPASLRRHQAGGWCGKEEEEEGVLKDVKAVAEEDHGSLLTGAATLPGGTLYRRWECPMCDERFHRVYDVQRHLGAAHDTVVDDLGTRALLVADGQTGEDSGREQL